jgi:hypothetical protein
MILRLAKRWGAVLAGGGMVLALAGCMSAFPEKPVTDAEPGPLAKRLAGNFVVTIAGEEYLLNLHPAGYNYGTNNIVGLTLSGARNPFEVVARSHYEVPPNVDDLRRGLNRLQKYYYAAGEVGEFYGKHYFVDKLKVRRGRDDVLSIHSFTLHRTGFVSFAYPTRTVRGIERLK